MNIPLVAGRVFTEQDENGKSKIAIINEWLARKYFGEPKNALGQLMARGSGSDVKFDIEIVGVVGDTKHQQLRADILPTVYRPFFQDEDHPQAGFMQYYVRTWQAPEAAETTLRHAVQQTSPKLVIDTMRTMDEQIGDNISNDRLVAMLALSFGFLATVLAAIGLYGVLAYVTAQRTREIGIRIALGADRGDVLRMVIAQGLKLAISGVTVGVLSSLALGRILSGFLYGVSPTDPMTIVGVAVLLTLVALLASYLPARRATRVDPMVALRYE
jgi:predicted permease